MQHFEGYVGEAFRVIECIMKVSGHAFRLGGRVFSSSI